MIHVLDRGLERQARILRGMFEARKRVFVDLLGWDVPVLHERYEIDEFDDEHAVYIVLADEHGGHLGSARLLETTRPHILADIFPELCGHAVPRGPDIREITRFCLDRGLNAGGRRQVRNQLVTAIAEYALASGICRYTCVAERVWLKQVMAFGWRCATILPGPQDEPLAALSIEIDDETPALLADSGIYALPTTESFTRKGSAFSRSLS